MKYYLFISDSNKLLKKLLVYIRSPSRRSLLHVVSRMCSPVHALFKLIYRISSPIHDELEI
jgi:hypothetical protein